LFLDLFLFKTLCCACCNLGLFGSKGPFMHVVLCHRRLWYVNSFVLAVGSFLVSYLGKYSIIIFFAIWFRVRTRVRWIVSDEFVFVLVFFHLLRLAPKTTCSWFYLLHFCVVHWVRLMSPSFLCNLFYFMFNLFGIGQRVPSTLIFLKKTKFSWKRGS
jgi:hypothetical protein